MVISTKIRLFPTKEQEELFFKFSNTARFAYNESLAYRIDKYNSEGYSCKVQDLIEHLQDMKYSSDFSWLQETPEAVTKQAIKDLDKAYKLFFQRGNKGFPKFKRKGKCTVSFYQRTDKFKRVDDTHIKITGIKQPVRIRETILPTKVQNPRVIYDGKYWYISLSFDVPTSVEPLSDEILGVDLGIKNLAVVSDNRVYKNINKSSLLRKLEKKKIHLQHKLSRKYTLNKEGSNFVKTNNILRLEQTLRLLNRRIRNIRDTYVHTVTADLVRTKPKRIVIEDLNVSGMLKNKHLSKAIAQQNFYKFRQYLEYKCKYWGIDLVLADRFYPSTKLCSCCGHKKSFISLGTRTYKCECCGKEIDRDLNASLNLKNYGLAL